jgi:Beta-lactamase enzyme family
VTNVKHLPFRTSALHSSTVAWCSCALASVAFAVLVLASPAHGRELVSPRTAEVCFGTVLADGPRAATHAALYLGDRRVQTTAVSGNRVTFRLTAAPGRYDVRVRFERAGRLLRRDESRHVWLLPPVSRVARRERSRDSALVAGFAALGSRFPGYAALWAHDLRTGRTAGWNSDAPFPAASTVKLGVLVAALRRYGPRPERSSAWPLIRDLALWSSNDASNRLLLLLGGSEAGGSRIAQETMHRMGATSSTFTGNYRLGTGRGTLPLGDAPRPLPFLTFRRTTAHDLGRMLYQLHAAAVGNRLALRRTGLSRHEARVGLGLLLSGVSTGHNLGLFRPSVGPRLPMVQKQGWTTKLRHTAAIAYGSRGPRIVILLTYASDLDPSASHALGGRIVFLVRRRWKL